MSISESPFEERQPQQLVAPAPTAATGQLIESPFETRDQAVDEYGRPIPVSYRKEAKEEEKKPFTWRDTWPVKFAEQFYSGVTAPGQVSNVGWGPLSAGAGQLSQVQPQTPGVWTDEDEARLQMQDAETFHRTMDTAQLGVRAAPGVNPVAIPGAKSALSRGEQLFAPPVAQAPSRAVASATPRQLAAVTSHELGQPLPWSVTSESQSIRGGAARAQEFPFGGGAITKRIGKAEEAGGEKIKEISGEMLRGADERATAGTQFEQGLDDVLKNNRAEGDALYGELRSQMPIGPNGRRGGDAEVAAMPRLKAELDRQVAERRLHGQRGDMPGNDSPNPNRGFGEMRNIQDLASFNGAQELRSKLYDPAREGYDKFHFDRIHDAMTADMRELVGKSAQSNGMDSNRAIAAFDKADLRYSQIKEENALIQELQDRGGEKSLGQMMTATSAKSGDFQKLAQLKQIMPPDKFELIGGSILNEAGKTSAGGFSLDQLGTRWNGMSSAAKAVTFDNPAHRKWIDDIVNMNNQMKNFNKESNKSHSGGAFVGFEWTKTLGELAVAAGAGALSGAQALTGAAGLVAPPAVGWLLARPSRAASVAAFMKARNAVEEAALAKAQTETSAVQSGPRTAARFAMYKLAARNLANTLNIPIDQVLNIAQLPANPPTAIANEAVARSRDYLSQPSQSQQPTREAKSAKLQGTIPRRQEQIPVSTK